MKKEVRNKPIFTLNSIEFLTLAIISIIFVIISHSRLYLFAFILNPLFVYFHIGCSHLPPIWKDLYYFLNALFEFFYALAISTFIYRGIIRKMFPSEKTNRIMIALGIIIILILFFVSFKDFIPMCTNAT